MLRQLQQSGVKRVLVTGSGQSSLIDRLDSDFPGAFAPDMRITALHTRRGKLAPDPYLAALDLAGVEPWQARDRKRTAWSRFGNGLAGVAVACGITTSPVPQSALADAGRHCYFPLDGCLRRVAPRLAARLRPGITGEV